MTTHPNASCADSIDSMPRAGFDAGWLDRKLQTARLEYLDRDDPHLASKKRAVVRSLHKLSNRDGLDDLYERLALAQVADIAEPRILELGAAHGGLSRRLLELHPHAHLTVTDIEPISVADMAAGDLGAHPRATVRVMDALAIDAPDQHYDLAIFVMAFHHLPPRQAAAMIAEGTRAAKTLFIVDLRRLPAPLLAVLTPAAAVLGTVIPIAHDAWISQLRAYSPSALRALAAHADPNIHIELELGDLGGVLKIQQLVARRVEPTPSP
ncbi:class I SAM-dependent methyltransferase [Nocardia sp. NBC_01499]|uniref:class I SAM-dependent methyltransferase n=1 Tax=Nocardia sp. NBC_01499 TaxID=2903597 RepID=UPI00386E48D6